MAQLENELGKLAEKAKKENDVYNYAILIQLGNLDRDIQDIKDTLEHGYATKSEVLAIEQRIKMLERIIYGAVGLILTAVFLALIALVVR